MARPTNIPEVPRTGEAPRAFAERLAKEKAFVVFQRGSGDFVLGADTVVVVDAQILGKPKDVEDAARMLRLLSGRTHDVVTGICLFSPRLDDAGSKPSAVIPDVQSELTVVTMESLADEDIRSYIATGEPMDKAGSYAIQGIASRWISRIEGDYSNVVGLPVSRVYRMLKQRGAI